MEFENEVDYKELYGKEYGDLISKALEGEGFEKEINEAGKEEMISAKEQI